MKRKFFGMAVGLGGALLSVLPAAAKYYGLVETGRAAEYNESDDIFVILAKVMSAFLAILAFVFFGWVLYAGLRWMTARGNEEFVERAKNSLESAIIGLSIILASYALVRFVLVRLGAS